MPVLRTDFYLSHLSGGHFCGTVFIRGSGGSQVYSLQLWILKETAKIKKPKIKSHNVGYIDEVVVHVDGVF